MHNWDHYTEVSVFITKGCGGRVYDTVVLRKNLLGFTLQDSVRIHLRQETVKQPKNKNYQTAGTCKDTY